MKKIALLLLVLGIFLVSSAVLAEDDLAPLLPEDEAGRESSTFMPPKVKGAPAPAGTDTLAITGPVPVLMEGEKEGTRPETESLDLSGAVAEEEAGAKAKEDSGEAAEKEKIAPATEGLDLSGPVSVDAQKLKKAPAGK